jgi:hypothetical protein
MAIINIVGGLQLLQQREVEVVAGDIIVALIGRMKDAALLLTRYSDNDINRFTLHVRFRLPKSLRCNNLSMA